MMLREVRSTSVKFALQCAIQILSRLRVLGQNLTRRPNQPSASSFVPRMDTEGYSAGAYAFQPYKGRMSMIDLAPSSNSVSINLYNQEHSCGLKGKGHDITSDVRLLLR